MNKKTILYAEDCEGVRTTVSEIIKEDFPQINLELFSDGVSLEKKLLQGSNGIDMVLTDNNMPFVSGIEIIKKYSKTPSFQKIPFVLLYCGSPLIGEFAVENGAFGYLMKDEKDLLRNLNFTIKKALNL